MTIAKFGSVSSATDTGGGTFAVNKPSGTVDNEWMFMVLGCSVSGGQSIAPPGGWTLLYQHAPGFFGVWRRLALSEPANYTITQSGGSGQRSGAAAIVRLIGADPANPPIVGAGTVALASTSVKAAGMLAASGAALVYHIGCAHDSNDTTLESAPPGGMAERLDIEQNDGGTGLNVQLAISEKAILPGATSDLFATLDIAADNIGIQLIVFQAPLAASVPDEHAALETLFELTHWDENLAAETVKKYSARGVTFTGGEHYAPRLINSVEISQSAIDFAAVGGVVATTVSQILLRNDDGGLDSICYRGLAVGRTAIIKTVKVMSETATDLGAGAVSNAVTVFAGVVSRIAPSGDNMVVSVSDLTERLNVPLQTDEYSGTSGFGGGTEKKGLTKPALFGRAYNLLPEQLGTISGRETFQVHSRAVNAVSAVYIRGVAQTNSGGVAPAVGEYRALLTDGAFELGASPDGDVTCTAKGDDPTSEIYANQHGEVLDRMLKNFGPLLSTGEVESSTFTDVDSMLPGEIGLFLPAGDRSTVRQVIERVLKSGGIWLAGGRNGKVRLSMARPGLPAERLYLKEHYISAVRPIPVPSSLQPTPSTIQIETERNWHPLANIASSVTGGSRRALSGRGRTVESISTALETRQKPKRAWPIVGLWFNDTDGQMSADQIRAWVEQGLRAIEVETDRYPNQVELGMGCEIESYPRFGLGNGFFGIVAGWREKPSEARVTLTLLGVSPAYMAELREDGVMVELREDGSVELRE